MCVKGEFRDLLKNMKADKELAETVNVCLNEKCGWSGY